MPNPSYVVITPIRDEEKYLPLALVSMYAQTVKPRQWILVNDGSRDATGRLIDEAAAAHPWIKAIHRSDRGSRQAGSGVIATFYEGFKAIDRPDWDFVAKFDGDLAYAPDYFERCLREFAADPKLGIGGGTCCKPEPDRRQPEFANEPPFHVRGPTKIYRRACFEAIGGLVQAPGWDTIDLIKATMLGWKTRTFPYVLLIHLRATGGAYGSWADYVKNGLANYITGYDPIFMACKCARRLLRRPHMQGLALWCGFMKGYFRRIPRVNDPAMIRYLRREQWKALTFRPTLWR